MKKSNSIALTAVITLLVVVIVLLTVKAIEPQSERQIKGRIKQLKVIKEEQQLTYDIIKLRYETAVIQAKMTPNVPQIEK